MSALLLLAALAPAAPVLPPSPNADRERLEALWNDLSSYDPVARTKAAFALADHPAGVKFLEQKAHPVDATAEQIKGWLADLNSDDEKEATAAYEKLRYFDPQLALTPTEQLVHVSTDNGRHHLATLWWGEPITRHAGFVGNKLTVTGHDSFAFDQYFRGPNGASASDTNGTLFGIAHMRPDDWRRAALAAVIFDRIDTKASRAALLKLASGHPKALPTRTANALLRARFALPSPFRDEGWSKLLDFDPIQTTRWAFELADHPQRVTALKAKLPAIKATKEQVTGWLKALNSEKAEEWKPAFEKLMYFRPQLALSVEELCESANTSRARWRVLTLCHLHTTVVADDTADDCESLEPCLAFEGVVARVRTPKVVETLAARTGTLAETTPLLWQRARVAVLALQRAGTPEAKAVLRQLVDGHPDILPTREAKAALK